MRGRGGCRHAGRLGLMGITVEDPRVRLGDGRVVESAGPGRRFAARLLDMALLGPALLLIVGSFVGHFTSSFAFAMATVMESDRDPGFEVSPLMPLHAWAALAVLVFYEPVMVARWGATVGKRVMGIRVVRFADGKVVSAGRSWARVALPTAAGVVTLGVGWLVVWCAVALSVSSGRDWRGWHDTLARTVVVRASALAVSRPGSRGRSARRRQGIDRRWQEFIGPRCSAYGLRL